MNIIITINNAQMRNVFKAKFIGAQMLIEKKIRENTLCRHGENPIDQSAVRKAKL